MTITPTITTTTTTLISIDLLDRARRSETFPSDWSEAQTMRALRRYEQFLLLVAKHPGLPMAPTRDIDEMWHLHMMSPRAYHADCQRLFGTVLDHDGGFGADEAEVPLLQATFEATAQLWLEAFGEPYVDDVTRGATTTCWHDCQGRCWHACASIGQAA